MLTNHQKSGNATRNRLIADLTDTGCKTQEDCHSCLHNANRTRAYLQAMWCAQIRTRRHFSNLKSHSHWIPVSAHTRGTWSRCMAAQTKGFRQKGLEYVRQRPAETPGSLVGDRLCDVVAWHWVVLSPRLAGQGLLAAARPNTKGWLFTNSCKVWAQHTTVANRADSSQKWHARTHARTVIVTLPLAKTYIDYMENLLNFCSIL